MVWTSANGPKCPVSPEDRGEFMEPSQKSAPAIGPSQNIAERLPSSDAAEVGADTSALSRPECE
jgi:hypothetical protein